MPFEDPKPDPFKAGKTISAEALNKVLRATNRSIRGSGDTTVSDFSDRVVINTNIQRQGLAQTETYLCQFVILEEMEDTFRCAIWFPPTDPGTNTFTFQIYDATLEQDALTQIEVAKPYDLQQSPWDGQTVEINGVPVTYHYTDIGQRNAVSNEGKSDEFTEAESITAPYFPGDVITAVRLVSGYTDQGMAFGLPVCWIDSNTAGRKWQSDAAAPFCGTHIVTVACFSASLSSYNDLWAFDPQGDEVLFVQTPSVDVTFTGLRPPPRPGNACSNGIIEIEIVNAGPKSLTLAYASTLSFAQNRFYFNTGADVILCPGERIKLLYKPCTWCYAWFGTIPYADSGCLPLACSPPPPPPPSPPPGFISTDCCPNNTVSTQLKNTFSGLSGTHCSILATTVMRANFLSSVFMPTIHSWTWDNGPPIGSTFPLVEGGVPVRGQLLSTLAPSNPGVLYRNDGMGTVTLIDPTRTVVSLTLYCVSHYFSGVLTDSAWIMTIDFYDLDSLNRQSMGYTSPITVPQTAVCSPYQIVFTPTSTTGWSPANFATDGGSTGSLDPCLASLICTWSFYP